MLYRLEILEVVSQPIPWGVYSVKGLAHETKSAGLDSSGQLPTSLSGVVVRVNRVAAPLLYVSPTQINFLIPKDVEVGPAQIEVSTGQGGLRSTSVAIGSVAPALFSIDGSGTGAGAVQNGVTYSLGPFEVTTAANPTADKRTRITLYATGIRKADVTAVTSVAIIASGVRVPLTVEYSGPTPGFFGLDQINVVLPEQLDAAGVVGFQVQANSVDSNVVTAIIRARVPPKILSVSPTAVAPGARISVVGTGFIPSSVLSVTSREGLIFKTGDLTVPGVIVASSDSEIQALVPVIQPQTNAAPYQGSMSICVVIDQVETCAAANMMALLALLLQSARLSLRSTELRWTRSYWRRANGSSQRT